MKKNVGTIIVAGLILVVMGITIWLAAGSFKGNEQVSDSVTGDYEIEYIHSSE